MNHSINEYVAQAAKEGIELADLHFMPAQSFSPYMECSPVKLNQISLQPDQKLLVNPYYRFADLFSGLLSPDENQIEASLVNELFDRWMHLVVEMDQMKGMSEEAILREELQKDIKNSLFGDEIRECFDLFTNEEQEKILIQYFCLFFSNKNLLVFRNIMGGIFPHSTICITDQDLILIFTDIEKNWMNQRKIEALILLFLPLGMKYDLFWEKPFGILGEDTSIYLDEVELV